MSIVKKYYSRLNRISPRGVRGGRGRYPTQYEKLKKKLDYLGYICVGTIIERWICCGKTSCACTKNPSRRHGPYYQWTRKVGGKTEARMLSESLVRLYREGIRNHRRLDAILEQMRKISLLAFDAAKIHPKL